MSLLVSEYLNAISEKINLSDANTFYVYRGLKKFNFSLEPTAVRDKKWNLKELLTDQEKKISDSQKKGFHYSKKVDRKLFDLELLADLRHYGASSCLLDFTSNPLIALYFSCELDDETKNKDGAICILNCYDTQSFRTVSYKDIRKKELKDFLDGKYKKLWYWIPERFNERMADQDGVFIFGDTKIQKEPYDRVIVKASDKEQILDELEKMLSYKRESLFADKYSIGANEQKVKSDDSKSTLESAVYHIQTNQYPVAIQSLKKIIHRKRSLFKKICEKIASNLKDKKNLEFKNIILESNFQLVYSLIQSKILELSKINNAFQNEKDNAEKDKLGEKLQEEVENMLDYKNHHRYKKTCKEHNYKTEKITQIEKDLIDVAEGLKGKGFKVPEQKK